MAVEELNALDNLSAVKDQLTGRERLRRLVRVAAAALDNDAAKRGVVIGDEETEELGRLLVMEISADVRMRWKRFEDEHFFLKGLERELFCFNEVRKERKERERKRERKRKRKREREREKKREREMPE